jgi:transposase
MKTEMDRKTASKYLSAAPPNYAGERTWRTREDPFEENWSGIERKLESDAELEAAALFEELERMFPGRYRPAQLRTLQCRVKHWKAQDGPEKEIWFP